MVSLLDYLDDGDGESEQKLDVNNLDNLKGSSIFGSYNIHSAMKSKEK